MKGTVNGVMYSGTRDLTIVEIQLEGNQAEAVEKFKGMHVDVSLKKFKRQRSLDANRYYWALIGKLRYVTGQPKSDIYKDHVRDVGGNYSIACVADKDANRVCRNWQRNGTGWITEVFPSKLDGCTNIFLYEGSSIYDTRQMSRLIDLRVQDCQAVGIETMTPDQIAQLVATWRNDK